MDRGLKVCVDVTSCNADVYIRVGGTVLSPRLRYAYLTRGWDRSYLTLLISVGEDHAYAYMRTWKQIAHLIGGRPVKGDPRRVVCLDGRSVSFCDQPDGGLLITMWDKEGVSYYEASTADFSTRRALYRDFLKAWEAYK